MIAKPLMTSKRSDWNTPGPIVDLVRTLAGGKIGLDPCSNGSSIVGAKRSWTIDDDGLAQDWRGNGLVYVNPPYGRQIAPWIEKAVTSEGAEIVMLIPSRTDTRWFQRLFANADGMCFWAGRLRFIGAKSPAPFPSAVAYMGKRAGEFLHVFGNQGQVVIR